jgi:hypothetical protein
MLVCGRKLLEKRDSGEVFFIFSWDIVSEHMLNIRLNASRQQDSFYGIDLNSLYQDAKDEMFGKSTGYNFLFLSTSKILIAGSCL